MTEPDKWHELQPIEGETIAHCGHLDDVPPPHHYYKVPFGMRLEMRAPDGTAIVPTWLLFCQICHDEFQKTGQLPNVRGHGTYKGNAPSVVKVEDAAG